MAQDDIQTRRFTIDQELTRQYRLFNAEGTQLTVRLLPQFEGEDSNPMSHFVASVAELFEYALRDCEDSDIVGVRISNEVNVQDKGRGISFRRSDHITGDVTWSVFEKVAQSNARFNAVDKLGMTVHSVKMPKGFGGESITTNGRTLEAMAQMKRSIVEVKAKENCLAHALIISIAR